VPERYEIKAGRIGKMQGEKNDPAPASAETRTFASTTKSSNQKCINSFVQFDPRFVQDLSLVEAIF
jgi:hypothetical protein